MPKRRLSPQPEVLPLKRHHNLSQTFTHAALPLVEFDLSFYDEVILHIFSYLPWHSLCAIQCISKNWCRLAADNQLWKRLYLTEYGRYRLRGGRGFVGRADGREIRPLPGRAKGSEDAKDWKWMFRISSNWRRGRCSLEPLSHKAAGEPTVHLHEEPSSARVIIAGALTIVAAGDPALQPEITLHSPGHAPHVLLCPPSRLRTAVHITALVLDQYPPTDNSIRLAAFLSSGSIHVFLVDHVTPSSSPPSPVHSYTPAARTDRNTPVIQAAYHHPLLITLSAAFHLSLYELRPGDDVSVGSAHHCQTLSSFTSFPPSSLVLSTQTPGKYKLVLAYGVPVYPHHWSVGATELLITGSRAQSTTTLAQALSYLLPEGTPDFETSLSTSLSSQHGDFRVSSTRTVRAIDIPQGWIDDRNLRAMQEQWGRKLPHIADCATDGKWVVLGPGDVHSLSDASSSQSPPATSTRRPLTHGGSMHSPTSLQLYRLSLPTAAYTPPKLTFVRDLYGQTGAITALSLADGRCVSLGANGSLWVWDLEAGSGTEVAAPSVSWEQNSAVAHDECEGRVACGAVVFDERRIVSAGRQGVQLRRFDV